MTDYEYGIRNKQRNRIHRSGMTAAQAYRWITEDWESSQDQVHKLFEIVYRPTQSWTALTLPPKPAPLVCPECGEASDWIIAEHDPDDPWELDGEWWHDPLHDPNDLDSFVCSRRCYLPRYRRSKDVNEPS